MSRELFINHKPLIHQHNFSHSRAAIKALEKEAALLESIEEANRTAEERLQVRVAEGAVLVWLVT